MATVDDEPRELSTELREAVRCSQWGEVTSLIRSPDCPDDHRLWAIDKTVQEAPERSVEGVLQLLVDDQLDNVLRCLLSRRLWRCVGRVLQCEVSLASHRWAVEEGVRYADWSDFAKHILPHCSSEERELVLPFLVSRGLWKPVDVVLKLGVSAPQQQWAVEQASRHVSPAAFRKHILPHCTEKDLELALTHLVSRGLWEAVGDVLNRGVGATHHKRAVVSAVRHADEINFTKYIFHHCTEEELEVLYMNRVSRGQWDLADRVTHGEITVTEHILSQLVSQHQWKSVGKFLQRDISGMQHRWAVEQASKHAHDFDFVLHILPQCHDEELERASVYPVLLNCWGVVLGMLDRNLTSKQHSWAVEQASKHASDCDFVFHILPQCHDEELEHVSINPVSQDLWEVVSRMVEVQGNLTSKQHGWAVEQASKHAGDREFCSLILPWCHDNDLESITTHLVSRGLWVSFGEVIKQGVSSAQRRLLIEQAIKHTPDYINILRHIGPCCTEEELTLVVAHMVSQGLMEPAGRGVSAREGILSQLMSHGLWHSVGRFLQPGISDEQCRWAWEQAWRHATYCDLLDYTLPQCHVEKLKSELIYVVSPGAWKKVGKALKRGVAPIQRWWAIKQASRWATEEDFVQYILPVCHRKELENVCTHQMFLCLKSLLSSKRAVSIAKDRLNVVEVIAEQGASRLQDNAAVVEATKHLMDILKFLKVSAKQCASTVQDNIAVVVVAAEATEHLKDILKFLKVSLGQCASTVQDNSPVVEATKHLVDILKFVKVSLGQCASTVQDNSPVVEATKHLVDILKFVKVSLGQYASTVQDNLAVVEATKHLVDILKFVKVSLGQCASTVQDNLAVVEATKNFDDILKFSQVYALATKDLEDSLKVLEVSAEQGASTVQDSSTVVKATKHLEDILTALKVSATATKDLENSLKVLDVSAGQGASTVQDNSTVVKATKHRKKAASNPHILRCCSEDDIVAELTLSVANKNWKQTQNVLYENVCDTLYTWVVSGPDSPPHDTLFWKIIQHCHVEVSLALDLVKAVAPKTCVFYDDTIVKISSDLAKYVSWQRPLCEALMTALLHTLCYVMCSDDRDYTHTIRHTRECVSSIYTNITDCIRDNTDSLQGNKLKTIQRKGKWTTVFTEIADTHKLDPLFLLHFLRGLNLYHSSRRGKKDDDILLAVLAVFPLFPQLQSVALRMMLRKQRWDVIGQACLSHVWEQDQRLLFRAAVMQGQWDVVRQWCDHTVHDDQRLWALTEAFKEKQWEVFLLLADHGLTPAEQMHAHYIVAKHGDWDTVLHMVERGGDITEVSDLLENWVSGSLRKKPEGDTTVYEERCMKLIRLRLRFAKNSALSPKKALEHCQWGSVLFNILHKPKDGYFTQVLDKVRREKAWHILMHLVRLGMSRAERNTLFPQIVKEQQWGVCRTLLQYGVDVHLCLEALPELLERNQWTLVAMVMEYDVDNAVRCQVMWYAFQRRAGALFWHCLTITQDKEHMPVDSRRKLFHQAISRDIWQAVKPFIEDKDDTGIRSRDTAFLEAIEQHLWDVVDYCQLHGADINMKDENGETPLHREARKREWKAVKEIVLRDAQPNLLDKDGVCVLNRLIDNKQWEVVKIVIVYGGDIHLQAKFSEYSGKTHTPLQALIDVRQADIIKFSILWCGGQKEGVNNKGETVFHAVCDSDRWDAMEDLIARKVDPLALTRTGKSPLVYAVLNSKCPQRMVTECSRAGFSLYQPSVTGPQDTVPDAITHGALAIWKCDIYSIGDDMRWNTKITSPLVCAVLRDMADVVLMLYDSGSCSSSELLTLCAQLPRLIKPGTEENRKLQEEFHRQADVMLRDSLAWTGQHRKQWMQYYHRLTHIIEKHTAFLTKLASTPRTLRSSCRLRISRHLHFTDSYRQVYMDDFPLPLVMKNYLNYSDFLDPGYGQHMGLPPKEGREQ